MSIFLIQHGIDGFGHQLHGLFTTMILHKIKNIYFNADTYINKHFSFEHLDEQETQKAKEYLIECVNLFKQDNLIFSKKSSKFVQSDNILNLLEKHDEKIIYSVDNAYYFEKLKFNNEETSRHKENIVNYKKYFINKYLPTCKLEEKNIVIHVRLGDALNTCRKLSLLKFKEELIYLIEIFNKKYPEHTIYLHTDGDVNFLNKYKIKIFTKKETSILDVLSDFIHAKIFVSNDSSLSEVSCFLGNKELILINNEAVTSKPDNVIKISDYIHLNRFYLENND